MKYEYLYVAFRLKGRGYTGELVDLHIDGVPSYHFKLLPEMLGELGEDGWNLRTSGDKGEHGTYESMIFQRVKNA